MGDVLELRPKQLCCELDCCREATNTVRLVDERGCLAGRKFFCDEHGGAITRAALSAPPASAPIFP